MTFKSSKDTSDENLSKMTVKEKLDQAGSIQVVQKILTNNLNDVNFEDWIFAWKVIEEKHHQNIYSAQECVIKGWVPVGIQLIDEITKKERIYDIFKKPSKVLTSVRNYTDVESFISQLMSNMVIFLHFYIYISHLYSLTNEGMQRLSPQPLPLCSIFHINPTLMLLNHIANPRLYPRLEPETSSPSSRGEPNQPKPTPIQDMKQWLDSLERLISCSNDNKTFIRECVELKFLSLGEQFLHGMSFSQAHHVLLKLEYLLVRLDYNRCPVNSFVRKFCLQEVLGYVPKNTPSFDMYIDMMGSMGAILYDGFLNQKIIGCDCPRPSNSCAKIHNDTCWDRLLKATCVDILPFIEVCFAQIIQNSTKVKNLEQIKKIVGLSRKFKSPSTEVSNCRQLLQKLEIEGAQQVIKDMPVSQWGSIF